MQVAKEKVVLIDWRDQTLCKRRYLFNLAGLEWKHWKEIVIWKPCSRATSATLAFTTMIDYNLQIIFYNYWFWSMNLFLQWLILIYESFSLTIDHNLSNIFINDYNLQWFSSMIDNHLTQIYSKEISRR